VIDWSQAYPGGNLPPFTGHSLSELLLSAEGKPKKRPVTIEV